MDKWEEIIPKDRRGTFEVVLSQINLHLPEHFEWDRISERLNFHLRHPFGLTSVCVCAPMFFLFLILLFKRAKLRCSNDQSRTHTHIDISITLIRLVTLKQAFFFPSRSLPSLTVRNVSSHSVSLHTREPRRMRSSVREANGKKQSASPSGDH